MVSMKSVSFNLCVLLLIGLSVSVVRAQENDVTESYVPPASNVVIQRQDLSQDIFDLQRSYRGQLDEYRRYEREYRLAFEQHAKLQTLASLEALVQATHRVMATRILVLETYFRLMRVTVLDAEGINLQHKERLLAATDEALTRIGTHKEVVARSQNRTALQQVVVEYEPLHKYLETVGNYGQAVILVGRLQNVYDNSYLLLAEVKEQDVTHLSALELSQRQRGIEEIEGSLQEVQQELQQATTELSVMWQRNTNYYELHYLPDVYDTLSKVLSFFSEVR